MIRKDFWHHPSPTRLTYLRWAMVALAASVPLGSALTNVLTGVVLALLLLTGGLMVFWRNVRANPFALASLGLWILLIVGASWSTGSFEETIRVIEKHARVLLAVFAVALMSPPEWRRRALIAWFAVMALTLLLSYVHSFWAFPFARATREGAIADHYIFKHHITQNVMMSVFAASALAFAIVKMYERHFKLALLGFAVALAASINILFFVIGRTGYLTLAVSLVAVAIFLARGWHRLYFAAGVAALFLTLVASSATVKERMQIAVNEAQLHDGTNKTSVGMRVEFAQKSLELIAARPLVGYGTGSYSSEFCRVASSVQWCSVGHYNPHNQFLFFGVQLGALGMLALLAWIGLGALTLVKTPPLERAIGVAMLATFCVHSLLDSPLYINTEGVWYPLGLGILMAGYRRATRG